MNNNIYASSYKDILGRIDNYKSYKNRIKNIHIYNELDMILLGELIKFKIDNYLKFFKISIVLVFLSVVILYVAMILEDTILEKTMFYSFFLCFSIGWIILYINFLKVHFTYGKQKMITIIWFFIVFLSEFFKKDIGVLYYISILAQLFLFYFIFKDVRSIRLDIIPCSKDVICNNKEIFLKFTSNYNLNSLYEIYNSTISWLLIACIFGSVVGIVAYIIDHNIDALSLVSILSILSILSLVAYTVILLSINRDFFSCLCRIQKNLNKYNHSTPRYRSLFFEWLSSR